MTKLKPNSTYVFKNGVTINEKIRPGTGQDGRTRREAGVGRI